MGREIKYRAWSERNKCFADYEEIAECLYCQDTDGWKMGWGAVLKYTLSNF